jgi:hypothetical protein
MQPSSHDSSQLSELTTITSQLKPMATNPDRQKRIMEHLARSTNNFIQPTLNNEQRKQQIMQHIRLTRG